VLEHLGALVDKSLVVARGGDVPRYLLLETTRTHALEKLAQAGEIEAVVRRHAHCVRSLFEQLDDERFGDAGTLSQDEFVDRVKPEMDNLRGALAWATSAGGDDRVAIALAAASAEAFFVVGPAADGLTALRSVMSRVPEPAEDAIAARFWVAVSQVGYEGRFEDGTFARALAAAEDGCRRYRWMRRLACVLFRKAWRSVGLHDFEAARSTLTEAAAIETPHWPGWLRCDRWNTHFHCSVESGDFEAALAALDAMKSLLPQAGEQRRHFRLIVNCAVYFNIREQWNQAEPLLSGLVDDEWRRRNNAGLVAWAYGPLVQALTQLGRLDEARRRLLQALPLWRGSGIMHVWSHVVIRLVVAEGRIGDAMRLVGAEDVATRQFGRHYRLARRTRADSRALIEAAEPDPARRECWRREGEALDEDSIVALWLGNGDVPTGATASD
jgi:hypothetical protein